MRTRIRIDILPRLTHESPGIVSHLNALADRMLELAEGNPLNSLALSRSQAEELKHVLRNRRDMAEIALGEGWVVKLEKRKLRSPH
jgi:hypothetical protein